MMSGLHLSFSPPALPSILTIRQEVLSLALLILFPRTPTDTQQDLRVLDQRRVPGELRSCLAILGLLPGSRTQQLAFPFIQIY